MNAFFKKTIIDFKWTLIWYTVIAAGYSGMITGLYPSIKASSEKFTELFKTYPKAMIDAFGIKAESFTTLGGFLSAELFALTFIILMSVLVFSVGSSLVAGEVDRGTSEFTFTFPARRAYIFLGKFAAAAAILTAVVVAALAACTVGGMIIGERLSAAGVLGLTATLLSLGYLLLALTAVASAAAKSKGMVNAVMGGFLFVSYTLHILNGVTDKVGGLYGLSFFKYYGNPADILQSGHASAGTILGFFSLALALLAGALFITERRDL